MKYVKKFLVPMLALMLLAALNVSAFAYTSTVYGGNNGNYNGLNECPLEGGTELSTANVAITNDKYFAKGFVEAGHGSETQEGKQNYTYNTNVTTATDRDADYVVVYGVAKYAITYTVTYTDSNGNQLREPDTYPGNIGDKPVVAAPYIDGYQPDYYSKTMTLTDGENIIPFVYTAITTAQPTGTTSPSTPAAGTTGGGTTGGTTGGTPGSTNAPDAPGTDTPLAADEQTEPAADENEPGTESINENDTPLAEPGELQDLDENTTPQGSFTQAVENFFADPEANAMPLAVRYMIVGGGLIVIGLGVYFLVRTLRKKKEE